MRHHPDDESVRAGTGSAPRRRRGRGRERERTRERVYASAAALFRRQGYADTSVAQIAEHAGIGRGTFFTYFPRKDCLISFWSQARLRELTHRLTPLLQDAPGTAEALRACMSVLSDLNEEEPELSAAMLTAWIQTGRMLRQRPHLSAVFAAIVEQGRARGDVGAAVSPERVGEALRDLYVGALHRWSHPGAGCPRTRLDTELQQAVSLLLEGLAPRRTPPPGA
ncbi:TetR/AcrR family transcriptional regulator [Kitasatospora sp. NPDC093806]|uniref:TetR/AcrR family transcriptional regulator n=1 Tax=Kitasatospora sp. NPDC093806 TaxID=3155075 RepID=UPI0034210AFB